MGGKKERHEGCPSGPLSFEFGWFKHHLLGHYECPQGIPGPGSSTFIGQIGVVSQGQTMHSGRVGAGWDDLLHGPGGVARRGPAWAQIEMHFLRNLVVRICCLILRFWMYPSLVGCTCQDHAVHGRYLSSWVGVDIIPENQWAFGGGTQPEIEGCPSEGMLCLRTRGNTAPVFICKVYGSGVDILRSFPAGLFGLKVFFSPYLLGRS